jgi:hypothetical protein
VERTGTGKKYLEKKRLLGQCVQRSKQMAVSDFGRIFASKYSLANIAKIIDVTEGINTREERRESSKIWL